MRYMIPIENIEELRKKAARISKKAAKHGVKVVFEELREVIEEEKDKDGNLIARKYVEVEAEGEAKFDGWVFAGTIEHTSGGNILRSVLDEHKIPSRYKDAKPYCEHCKTKRARKDTYVVYNEENDEFKQVGKNCMKEYTDGLSVEMAASVLRWLKEVEDARFYGGSSYVKLYEVVEMSKYFVETMHKFGWASSSSGSDSTKSRAMGFYMLEHGHMNDRFMKKEKELYEKSGFDINDISDEYIEAALEWARSYEGDGWNDYRENLKVIAQMKWCEYKHLGYLASLFMAYDKEMEKEIKRAERAKEKASSKHVSEVGKRVDISVKDWRVVTSWETQWGETFIYEFTSVDGDILIWKTSKWMNEEYKMSHIVGTVKAHSEFGGTKQTELTRCKVS